MQSEHWAYAYRRLEGHFVVTSRRQTFRSGEAIRWAAEGAAHEGGGIAFRVMRESKRRIVILCRFGDVPDDDAALVAGMRADIDRLSGEAAACGS